MPAQALHVVITGDPRGFQAALAKAGAATGAFAAKQNSTAAKVGKAGSTMSKGITVPLLAAGAVSVKFAADFEQQMSRLGSVTDAGAGAMEKLRKQALKAGADTAFSAREAAIAQTELAKGGVSTANILKGGLGAALSLAAAGELELGEAASITANAMNLFGLRGGEAAHVADAMATAANATTADVDDFGMALKQAGGVAKSAGLSFDDTMVALEALAKNGVAGSDAGTSLKTALIQLLKPSKKQAELADDLGLKFTTAGGKMKSLSGISTMLRDKLGGMTKAQRTATLAQLAGTDGVRTLTSLYDAGPKALDGFAKGLGKQGSAAETAAKKQDNLKGKLEQLKGSLETLAIVVGTALLPPITDLAQHLTKFATSASAAFQSLPEGAQTAVLAFAGVAAAVGPVLVVASKLISAWRIVAGALAAVSAPVALVVVGIAALAAGLIYAYKHSEAFRGIVQSAFNTLKTAGAAAVSWLSTALPAAWAAVKSGAAAVVPFLASAWAAVKPVLAAIPPLVSAIGARLSNLASIALPVVRAIAQVVGPVLAAAFRFAGNAAKILLNAVGPVMKGLLSMVRGVVVLLTGILRGDFSKMWQGVKLIFSGGVKAVVAVLRAGVGLAVAAARAIASGIVGAIRGAVGVAVSAASAIAHGIVGAVRGAVGAAVGAAKAIASGIVGAIRGAVGLAVAGAKAIASGVVAAVRGYVGAARSAASAIASGITGALRAVIGQAAGIGSAIISGLIGGIRSMAGQAANAAADVVKGAVGAAKRALKIGSPSKVFHGIGVDSGRGFENGLKATASKVQAAASQVAQGAVFGIEAELDKARDAAQALQDAFAFADKQREIDRAQRVAGRRMPTGNSQSAKDQRAKIKEARSELAKLTAESRRAQKVADIDFKIRGLERAKAFKDALGSIRGALSSVASDAASAFREGRERAIDADLKATLDAITNGPAAKELAAIRKRQDDNRRAAEDADAEQKIAEAKKKQGKAAEGVAAAERYLLAVQQSGSQRLIDSAQQRLNTAKAGMDAANAAFAQAEAEQRALADERRATELEAEISNAQAAAESAAQSKRDGLAQEEADFKASLQSRLDAETANLEARRQNYASFAAAVNAILGPLGQEFAGSADDEAAVNAPDPKKGKTPKPKKKKKKRATGGAVARRQIAELTRINELGPENVFLPGGARVVQASRSDDPQPPTIGQLIINADGAAARDPQALAAFIGFRFATTRR